MERAAPSAGPAHYIADTSSPDFPTIDPAPASSTGPTDVPSLRADLLNTKKPLFERYRAMFALRDYGGNSREAVLALAEGFGDESALFRLVQSRLFFWRLGGQLEACRHPAISDVAVMCSELEMQKTE